MNVVTALEFMSDSVRTRPGSGPATWQAGLCGRPGYRVQPVGSHTVRPVLADAVLLCILPFSRPAASRLLSCAVRLGGGELQRRE